LFTRRKNTFQHNPCKVLEEDDPARETIKHVGQVYGHMALIAGMAPEKKAEGNLKSENRTRVVRFMSGTPPGRWLPVSDFFLRIYLVPLTPVKN